MNELQAFEAHLHQNEKSPATIEKYLRDVRAFLRWLDGRGITKERTVCYKEVLSERYKAASVNAMLSGVNSYLSFLGHADCRVKPLPVQRSFFADEGRELSREEYARLVAAAKGTQLFYVLQTICGTGIRVSELRHITAEAVNTGRATVRSKGKTRVILLSDALRKLLRQYMKTSGVSTGCLFLNAHGGAAGSLRRLAADEAPVQAGGSGCGQGLSPRAAAPVCPCFLRHGKGSPAPCRPVGAQLHQYHPHLHAGRRQTPCAGRGTGLPTTAHGMLILCVADYKKSILPLT